MRIVDWIVNILAFLLVSFGIGSVGTVYFACLPAGAVLWIAYQAFRVKQLEADANRDRER